MKYLFRILLFILLLPLGLQAEVFDQIQSARAALALSNISLFADSTFSSETLGYLAAGSLLTVEQESQTDHEDDAQKQLFKWYRVKSLKGKTGWVFGDGVLIKENENLLSPVLRPYLYRKVRFTTGFENSMLWFGSIVGRDNFGDRLLSQVYVESYLVVTNQLGRSVSIPISNSSQFGENRLESFSILELTNDLIPEIVLQSSIEDVQNPRTQKLVHFYSFQGGTLRKIFEERLNVPNEENRLKHLIIDKGMIRAYYFESTAQAPALYSYTYYWNTRSRKYEILYAPAPFILRAIPRNLGIRLHSRPQNYSPAIATLNKSSQLQISSMIDSDSRSSNSTSVKIWAKVITDTGKKGFVPFKNLELQDINNAEWVEANLLSIPLPNNSLSCLELPEAPVDTSLLQN